MIKRYDMKSEYNAVACEDQVKFTECVDGSWVKHQDYAALQAERDAEVAENAVNDFCEWMLLSKRYSVAEWCGEYTKQLRAKAKQ